MPGDDWKFIPNSVTDAIDNQKQADAWAADQRAQTAQDWGNAQASIPAPSSDSLTNPLGTQHDVPLSPEPAAGASVPPPSEQSQVPPSPPAPVPAANTTSFPPADSLQSAQLQAPLAASTLSAPRAASAPAPVVSIPRGRPQTTAEISGGTAFQGFDTNANALVSWAGDQVRQQYGDDAARAVQSVLATEGGLNGARGDNGHSFGPLQFFRGGELANYARFLGVSEDEAGVYAEQHPQEAVQWALNGYLGDALQRGLKQGLSGADLATYIQTVGQRSQSPQRAGQWYNVLFGSGQDPFAHPITAGQAGASGITGAAQRTSQFSMGLSPSDAMAFCGPAAAIAFAQAYGRNPTVEEAKALAQQVGWNPTGGMAGVGSEQALLSKLGIQTKLEQTINWSHVADDANNGNPVIIDTPGHYFYVTGARQGPRGTEYNVGTSGTDLRAGSAWMTANDMARTMGSPRAALYADHPLASGASVAEQAQRPDVGQTLGSFASDVKQTASTIQQAVQNAGAQVVGSVQSAVQNSPIIQGQVDLAHGTQQAGQAMGDTASAGFEGMGIGPEAMRLRAQNDATFQKYSMQAYNTALSSGKNQLQALGAMLMGEGLPQAQQDWLKDYNEQQIQAIAGMEGGGMEIKGGRPLFGRGGVPGADVGRNPVPAPTTEENLQSALQQTQYQQIVKQIRDAGWTDDQIAESLRSQGVPEEQIQSVLNPQPLPTAPTAQDQFRAQQAQPTDTPPAIQFDQDGNVVAQNGQSVLPANPMQNVTPQGTLAPGVENIPGRQGGAEPPTMPKNQRPDLLVSSKANPADNTATVAPNINPNASPPGGPTFGQAVAALPAEMKKSIFSLSNIHAGNIARGLATSPAGPQGAAQFVGRYVQALMRGPRDPAQEAGMIETATNAIRDGVNFFGGQNPETGGAPAAFNPILVQAARAAGGGVFGAAGGAEFAHQTGDDENVLRDAVLGGAIGALGGPTVAMRMHDALWQDAVPFAKLITYQSAVNAGIEGPQAAKFANNLNGGQNLAAIAGSKPVQELARWALQSPDWLLSQVKLVGAGLAGTGKTIAQQPLTGNEQLSRDWLLKTLMVYGFATEAIQYGLTGHFTDQNSPGSQFQIEVPSGETAPNGKAQNVTVSLFPGNLQQILDAADRSVTQGAQGLGLTAWGKTNRIPATALETAYNFRYPGGPPITTKGASPEEAAQQKAIFAGSQFAPLGIFAPAQELAAGASPAATAFLTALGFPMSHNTRAQGATEGPAAQRSLRPARSERPRR